MTRDKFEREVETLSTDCDVFCSPDFQCDQTGGFPSRLCVCWEQGKAWLELADLNAPDVDLSIYRQMCADFGIRRCSDPADFNDLLASLGRDAYETAYLPEDEMTLQ